MTFVIWCDLGKLILGISALYHDSAAALIDDGCVVAAAMEERFTRRKHDARLPKKAVEYCLSALPQGQTVDYVAFYEKPLLKFDRILQTQLAVCPAGYSTFRKAIPLWLSDRLHIRRNLNSMLEDCGVDGAKTVFATHHESHAASAFYPSPFERAAIVTLDGVGEWATGSVGHGVGNRIELLKQSRFPHSLGLLYSAFTEYCGFHVNNGEYKLMGLAAYGQPTFRDVILERLMDLREDGSFRLDLSYFNFCRGMTMTSAKFHQLFGGPARRDRNSEPTERHKDLAASIQSVTEEVLLRVARHAHTITNESNLVLAGGVALNSVACGRLEREGPFENVWIQPAAGDAGAALGAALLVHHQLLESERNVGDCERGRDGDSSTPFFGNSFSDAEVSASLSELDLSADVFDTDEALCDHVANLLADGKVVGWFQGRMEFSPRALGARSILADPRAAEMKSRVNERVKFRESFRPFAPAVLREQAHEWFEVDGDVDWPHMTKVAAVRETRRGEIPAVTHVDGTARMQTVDAERNRLFHLLLRKFADRTGCPLLLNTSFNVRGEPIVQSIEDAVRCFSQTDLDAVVIGRHVIVKPVAHKIEIPPPRDVGGEKKPTSLQLRAFSVGWACFLPLLAWLLSLSRPWIAVAVLSGFGLATVGLMQPASLREVYRLSHRVFWPLRWVMREVSLLIVFWGVMLPTGIWFRLRGRDPLQSKWDRDVETYWENFASRGRRSYWRLF